MKEPEAKAIGNLIVLTIIASPFIWLFEKNGGIGVVIIVGVAVALYVLSIFSKAKGDQKVFEKLVRHVLHSDISVNEAQNINATLARSDDYRKAQLIRNLQILRDSIDLSLSSKKHDTAISRIDTLKEKFEDISQNQRPIISEDLFKEIETTVSNALGDFNTAFYVNVATGHIEKADSLKTDKPKLKCLRLVTHKEAE